VRIGGRRQVLESLDHVHPWFLLECWCSTAEYLCCWCC
jgi:hypothetical protein